MPMALRRISRTQFTLAGLSLLGLAWLMLMTLPHDGGRTGVLTQLEKPATMPAMRVGPGPVNTTAAVGGYTIAVRAAANHAALPQLVTVRLGASSGPVDGARVTVSYSMPSMNMPSALSAALPARGRGVYGARLKAIEMPGDWLISFRHEPCSAEDRIDDARGVRHWVTPDDGRGGELGGINLDAGRPRMGDRNADHDFVSPHGRLDQVRGTVVRVDRRQANVAASGSHH